MGRVIKVGADYVGLLVLGVFNAAIGAERIRREFKCSPEVRPGPGLQQALAGVPVLRAAAGDASGGRGLCQTRGPERCSGGGEAVVPQLTGLRQLRGTYHLCSSSGLPQFTPGPCAGCGPPPSSLAPG